MLSDTVEFYLDANQAQIADWFLRGLASTICVLGSRGAGKSGLLRSLILMAALSGRKQILYASQSNGNSLDQFTKLVEDETVKRFLLQSPDREPYTTKPIPTIRFLQSEVLFWSMEDHVSKRGLHPSLVLIDEAQAISRTAFSRTLYPMRSRMGQVAPMIVCGSCPDTDGTWLWKMYERGKSWPNDGGVKSFTMSTENSLAFKTPSGRQLLSEARANMAEDDFLSEYNLVPGGRGESFFRPADVDACIAAYDEKAVDLSKGTIMAYDPALGTSDPCAYAIMDLKGNVVLSHSIPKGTTDTVAVQEVVDVAKKWQSLVVVESNATAWGTYAGSLKLLLPHGVKEVPLRGYSTKAGEAKNILCKQLAWQMEHREMRFNPKECAEMAKQLKSLRDYKTPAGALQIKAPGRDHDDEAFCAVILGEALHRGWSPWLGQQDGYNPVSGLL